MTTPKPVPWSSLLSCLSAAFLGVSGVVLAVHGNAALQHYDSPLFPSVRRGIEGMNGATLVLLAVAAFIPAAFGKAHPLLVGAATIALFPLISFAEMVVDPRSHNLWPIEFVVYGVVAIPGVIGAYLGRSFRHRVWLPGEGAARSADERP